MADFFEEINVFVEKSLSNNTITTIIIIILVLYGGLAAPKLPEYMYHFFKAPIVSLLFMFLIAYIASKNTQIAIISSLILLLTIQILNKKQVVKAIKDNLTPENLKKVTEQASEEHFAQEEFLRGAHQSNPQVENQKTFIDQPEIQVIQPKELEKDSIPIDNVSLNTDNTFASYTGRLLSFI